MAINTNMHKIHHVLMVIMSTWNNPTKKDQLDNLLG